MHSLREVKPQPLDALLAEFAAGTLTPALHAMVGTHLELSPGDRPFVNSLERSLGREVAATDAGEATKRLERLNAIFALPPMAAREQGVARNCPRALHHYLGRDIEACEFRSILPGVKEYVIEQKDGMRAVLFRIRGGTAMPQHTHHGLEYTLILRGGFSDVTGHYGVGDIAITDHDVDHSPVADRDEECLCFAITDAPLKLTGPIGRLFNRFLKH